MDIAPNDRSDETPEEQARRLRIEKIKAMAGKVHFDGDLTELRGLELTEQI
jgi:hypothetical protein